MAIICLLAGIVTAAKITDYLTVDTPSGDDYAVIVDVSDHTHAETGTTKKIRLRDLPVSDPTATALALKADASSIAYPLFPPRTISNPADADDYYWVRAPGVLTLSGFHCIAQGTTPSITVDLQECSVADPASCTSVLSAPVTCTASDAAGTLTDTSVAAGAWMMVVLGAPSGTVTGVTWSMEGTQ
jgi:hypothetical protein